MLVVFLTGSSFDWINQSMMYNKIHTAVLKQYMDDKVMHNFVNKNIIAFMQSAVSEVDIIDIDPNTFFLTCLNNDTDEIINDSFRVSLVDFLNSVDEKYSGKMMLIVSNDTNINEVSGIVACCQQICGYAGGIAIKTIDEVQEVVPSDMA